MNRFSELGRTSRLYIATVVVLGGLVLLDSIRALFVTPIAPQWLALATLTVVTSSFSVKLPSVSAYLSVSEAFVFASAILFGPTAAVHTVLIETLVILFWMDARGRVLHRVLFSIAAPALALRAAMALSYLHPALTIYAPTTAPLTLVDFTTPLLMLTVAYFLINSWLVAIAIALQQGASPLSTWKTHFAWLAVNAFSGASVAAIIVLYGRNLDLRTVAIILPLLTVSYLTFRTAVARSSDTTEHLRALNRLYLSTIETLAMAIDAKDQVTHGHVRRVQTYALSLAAHLGITDEATLRALEAAALLHDMGKLAVPEHILNKPGRLTEAEFSVMKRHAAIGADILSSVDFPYPVVPIVRHHHEQWDGSGYPDHLTGTLIPLGARILAVVDCFDALTSDRPYRPRLSDTDALAEIQRRRGTTYDPLIVDAFVALYPSLPTVVESAPTSDTALTSITESSIPGSQAMALVGASSAPPAPLLITLEERAYAISGQLTFGQLARRALTRLAQYLPFTDALLFTYDPSSDSLVVRLAYGSFATSHNPDRVALGQRISGWVAATRRPIRNSDPALDLDVAGRPCALRHCLSAPLLTPDGLFGVLSLYSSHAEGFSEDNQASLSAMTPILTATLFSAVSFERGSAAGDTLPSLPTRGHLQQVVALLTAQRPDYRPTYLVIDAPAAEDQRRTPPLGAGPLLPHIVPTVRACLRSTDLLFELSPSRLVVLLPELGDEDAAALAARLARAFRAHASESPSATGMAHVTVTPRLSMDAEL